MENLADLVNRTQLGLRIPRKAYELLNSQQLFVHFMKLRILTKVSYCQDDDSGSLLSP